AAVQADDGVLAVQGVGAVGAARRQVDVGDAVGVGVVVVGVVVDGAPGRGLGRGGRLAAALGRLDLVLGRGRLRLRGGPGRGGGLDREGGAALLAADLFALQVRGGLHLLLAVGTRDADGVCHGGSPSPAARGPRVRPPSGTGRDVIVRIDPAPRPMQATNPQKEPSRCPPPPPNPASWCPRPPTTSATTSARSSARSARQCRRPTCWWWTTTPPTAPASSPTSWRRPTPTSTSSTAPASSAWARPS